MIDRGGEHVKVNFQGRADVWWNRKPRMEVDVHTMDREAFDALPFPERSFRRKRTGELVRVKSVESTTDDGRKLTVTFFHAPGEEGGGES